MDIKASETGHIQDTLWEYLAKCRKVSPDTIKGEKVATKLIGQVAKFLAPLM